MSVTVGTFACSDSLDNDGDSLIDYPDDLGCSGNNDASEVDITQCSDSLDNDGDGRVDYPNDLGCDSSSDDNEYNAPPATTGSGGGGGGGGGGPILPISASMVLKGRAYPWSKVFILKGAEMIQTTISGGDTFFEVVLNNITPGNQIFSVYSEDPQGNRSALFTLPVVLGPSSVTTIGGISIAPTLSADKAEVKRGDPLYVFGYTTPQSRVSIEVHSEEVLFGSVVADKDGAYSYGVDTGLLEAGEHVAQSTASINGLVSSKSKSVAFTVGTQNVLNQQAKKSLRGDVNGDSRVNLVDFSIAAFWYKKPSPPTKVDINGNGTVDLSDFSIMAFNWTG